MQQGRNIKLGEDGENQEHNPKNTPLHSLRYAAVQVQSCYTPATIFQSCTSNVHPSRSKCFNVCQVLVGERRTKRPATPSNPPI
jgi:hypothetical protein